MKNNTILVTGGAGFIGSHLCRKLVKLNYDIVCVDNLVSGTIDNIKDLLELDNFKFIRWDVTEPIDIECCQIYNLACPASPVHYQKDPIQTLKTSFLGISNMLELARKNNAKILQASTSEVYGDPLEHPQRETYCGNVDILSIRACYDEGKRVAETLMYDYFRQFKTAIRIVRIFNTYGPNMQVNDGRVVSNFITQALHGNDITIYGNGSQTRSFCYISDLLNGLYLMMNNEKDFIGPVNLGNPYEITISVLAELILKYTKSSSKIVYKPLPEADPMMRKPDIELAKKYLQWEPSVPLEEGLINTIEYFKGII